MPTSNSSKLNFFERRSPTFLFSMNDIIGFVCYTYIYFISLHESINVVTNSHMRLSLDFLVRVPCSLRLTHIHHQNVHANENILFTLYTTQFIRSNNKFAFLARDAPRQRWTVCIPQQKKWCYKLSILSNWGFTARGRKLVIYVYLIRCRPVDKIYKLSH